MDYVWLVAGFILLVKGADYFVEGSAGIAKKYNVPGFIIGMTIVAMGTSAPECAVSVAAALKGNNGIAIGNVIGSNIFNLLVVVGICAAIKPIQVKDKILKGDFPFSIFVGILLMFLCYDKLIFGSNQKNTIGRIDGALMLIIFVAFLIYMVRSAMKAKSNGEVIEEEEIKELPLVKCIVYIILGAAAIVLGGDLVVDSAKGIAKDFGMTDTLIGLTIVAFGTSLPELVTSVVAARKGEVDMALGNVIGSNIFNILLVLGISSAIHPIVGVSMHNIYDLMILAVVSIMTWIFAKTGKRINRPEGAVMLLVYTGYIVYACMR